VRSPKKLEITKEYPTVSKQITSKAPVSKQHRTTSRPKNRPQSLWFPTQSSQQFLNVKDFFGVSSKGKELQNDGLSGSSFLWGIQPVYSRPQLSKPCKPEQVEQGKNKLEAQVNVANERDRLVGVIDNMFPQDLEAEEQAALEENSGKRRIEKLQPLVKESESIEHDAEDFLNESEEEEEGSSAASSPEEEKVQGSSGESVCNEQEVQNSSSGSRAKSEIADVQVSVPKRPSVSSELGDKEERNKLEDNEQDLVLGEEKIKVVTDKTALGDKTAQEAFSMKAPKEEEVQDSINEKVLDAQEFQESSSESTQEDQEIEVSEITSNIRSKDDVLARVHEELPIINDKKENKKEEIEAVRTIKLQSEEPVQKKQHMPDFSGRKTEPLQEIQDAEVQEESAEGETDGEAQKFQDSSGESDCQENEVLHTQSESVIKSKVADGLESISNISSFPEKRMEHEDKKAKKIAKDSSKTTVQNERKAEGSPDKKAGGEQKTSDFPISKVQNEKESHDNSFQEKSLTHESIQFSTANVQKEMMIEDNFYQTSSKVDGGLSVNGQECGKKVIKKPMIVESGLSEGSIQKKQEVQNSCKKTGQEEKELKDSSKRVEKEQRAEGSLIESELEVEEFQDSFSESELEEEEQAGGFASLGETSFKNKPEALDGQVVVEDKVSQNMIQDILQSKQEAQEPSRKRARDGQEVGNLSNKRFKQKNGSQEFLNESGLEEQSFQDSSSESILEDSSSESDEISEVSRDSSRVPGSKLTKEDNTLVGETKKSTGNVAKTNDTQDIKSEKPSVFVGQKDFKFGFFGTTVDKIDESSAIAKHETGNEKGVFDKEPE